MTGLIDRAATYARLGIVNLFRVGLYRLGLRSGLHPVLRIAGSPIAGPYFLKPDPRTTENLPRPHRWTDHQHAFFAHEFDLRDVPDWNASPFDAGAAISPDAPWQTIGDFDSGADDIKAVWEASRWDWVVTMAQRATLGDDAELHRLNRWLADWQARCPPYFGPNWKCGQEASIRVMQLAAAALVMRQQSTPSSALLEIVRQHCRRIAPTVAYARGQDNNHGTSEAAALFIAGSWLGEDADGQKWAALGRRALEERCLALIEPDGTFSQYSVVYHRLLLDTVSLAETWRRRLGLRAFSSALNARLAQATRWLRQFVDYDTGDAPNIGANDGAMILSFADTSYRDFRPTVQWASSLFCGEAAFEGDDRINAPLSWLEIPRPDRAAPPLASTTFDGGGFHVLREGAWRAYLRYPRFRFRPSQADALHCDVWFGSRNIIRDAGSYCYAKPEGAAFSSTGYHSTVEFDGRDQMPRLSRFLFGSWLKTKNRKTVSEISETVQATASYSDRWGARHERQLSLSGMGLVCTDHVSGVFCKAALRWRLEPGEWRLEGNRVIGSGVTLDWEVRDGDIRADLVQGWESRHYLEASELPVLELKIEKPCTVVTRIYQT